MLMNPQNIYYLIYFLKTSGKLVLRPSLLKCSLARRRVSCSRNFHKLEGQVYILYFSNQEYWKFNILLILSVNFSTKPNIFLVLVEYKVTTFSTLWWSNESAVAALCLLFVLWAHRWTDEIPSVWRKSGKPSINNVSLKKIISNYHIIILTNV